MTPRLAVGVIAVAALLVSGCAAAPTAGAPPSPAPADAGACGSPTVTVSTSAELWEALDEAEPGTAIELESGVYVGQFAATAAGTTAKPISLCGPADAILDGGSTDKGYVLHLDGVSHWTVDGFTLRNGQKGLMADGVTDTTISGLTITEIGDEALHLRAFSSDNVVSGNTISDTGLRNPKFGEGIYVGTAESNWCDISDCEPDKSDRNVISSNTISGTTAESVDVKEGTTGGTLADNTFDGSEITDKADSWVDIKGNDWMIVGNLGTNSPLDGFQTHEILEGWGAGNVFRDNTANVNGPGFGYSLTPELSNVVECSNAASGAGEGVSNVVCTTR